MFCLSIYIILSTSQHLQNHTYVAVVVQNILHRLTESDETRMLGEISDIYSITTARHFFIMASDLLYMDTNFILYTTVDDYKIIISLSKIDILMISLKYITILIK